MNSIFHGEERNRHFESEQNETTEFVDTLGNVYKIPVPSAIFSVVERYCKICKQWVQCSDIVQYICCKNCHTSWTEKL